jgi:hypothetical protein
MLHVEFQFFLSLLNDLLLNLIKLIGSSLFGIEIKPLLFDLWTLILLPDSVQFLLSALLFLLLNISQSLLEEVLWDWIGLYFSGQCFRLWYHFRFWLGQVEWLGLGHLFSSNF